jgi:hypothetical protein
MPILQVKGGTVMTMRNIQPVINILSEVIRSNQVDVAKVNDAIDILEDVKDDIGLEDDEVIYKIDELQDYLQDLATLDEPSPTGEIKEEITEFIASLQKWSK